MKAADQTNAASLFKMDDLFGDLPPPSKMKIGSSPISGFLEYILFNTVIFLYFSASGGDNSCSTGNLYDDIPTPESRENKRRLEDGDSNELPNKRSAPRKTFFSLLYLIRSLHVANKL